MTVDTAAYRRAMGQFATGVTVITTTHDGDLYGMTANAVTSVSLDPVLLLVCFMKEARTRHAVERSGRFAVNVLDATQDALATHFARPGGVRSSPVPLATGPEGVPFLPDALAHLICRVQTIVPAGDHDVVLAEVEACQARSGAPLLYFSGGYHELGGPIVVSSQ